MTRFRTVGRVDVMTSRMIPGAVAALAVSFCLIAWGPAGSATAAPCDSPPDLLGLVGVCSPSSPASRPTDKPAPSGTPGSPGQPQPQPDPGAAVPSGGASAPSSRPSVATEPSKVPTPATTEAGVQSPIATRTSPSTQASTPAMDSDIGRSGSTQDGRPVAPAVSVAGILLAFGGALIAAGGMVGLRRYPPL
jgi:hypothetical protein